MLKCALLLVGAASLFGQIDPSIPLRVNPPNTPNLIQQMQEVQRLRNLRMQERVQAEELRRIQIENQARSASAGEHSAPIPKPPEVRVVDLGTNTSGLPNGRAWKQLSPGEKLMFVVGFSNGVDIANAPNFGAYVPGRLTNGEVIEGLDRFYLEPENVLLPMGFAVAVLAKKTSGTQQPDIDSLLAEARRWAIQVSADTPAK